MGKNFGKNISENLSGKYGLGMLAMRQKLLDHAKKSRTDALKIFQNHLFKKQEKKLVI